jgi:filamentous hemagglutinin
LSDKDTNGVIEARTMVRDPETGGWIENKSKTTLFPEMWSKRQVKEEVGEAFYNSESISPYEWEGISPSGVTIRGYYKRPEGSALTAWPVYGKVRH